MEDWVSCEFQELKLGDKRVDRKAKKIINTLSKQPGASIPKAFNTAYEVKDCYEFFHNGKVTAEKILAPHKKATIERIKNESVVLLPQDTSALNYSTKLNIRDLGNIGGSAKNKGLFLHPLLAITPSRINLGIVDAKIYVREETDVKLTDHQKYALPLEEKERPSQCYDNAKAAQAAILLAVTELNTHGIKARTGLGEIRDKMIAAIPEHVRGEYDGDPSRELLERYYRVMTDRIGRVVRLLQEIAPQALANQQQGERSLKSQGGSLRPVASIQHPIKNEFSRIDFPPSNYQTRNSKLY